MNTGSSRSSWDLYNAAKVDRVEAAILDMEQNGFKLDVPFCEKQAAAAQEQERATLDDLAVWLKEMGASSLEINWASPKQLAKLLHEDLGLPKSPVWKLGRVKPDETKLDETALDWLRLRSTPAVCNGLDALVRLRRIRGAIKYLTKLPTYVAPDGLVHSVTGPASDFDPRAGTITWRLAAKNPEVMQIPTNEKKDWFRVRKAFVAPENHTLLVADEKALEVVILAHLLIKLFGDRQLARMVEPGAPDIHSVNARLVFGTYLKWERYGKRVDFFPPECFQSNDYPELQALRQDIKAVWYGLMYGKGPYGFATSLRDNRGNPIGEEAATKIVAALYAAIPGIPKYQAFVLDYIQRYYGIPGLGGAFCDLSELVKSGNKWDLARASRIAQNYPMQEGGARIIGHAMVGIYEDAMLREMGLRIERQVHDELDFRVPVAADMATIKAGVTKHMTSYPLEACLQVSLGTGENWDEAGN